MRVDPVIGRDELSYAEGLNMFSNRGVGLAGAVLALVVTSGCGGDSDPESDKAADNSADATADGGQSGTSAGGDTPDGDNGRAFDSSDAAIESALKAALDAKKVEFNGKEVRVHMPSGSVDDPTAGLHCTAVEVVLADDEIGFLVYDDGEIDCRNDG